MTQFESGEKMNKFEKNTQRIKVTILAWEVFTRIQKTLIFLWKKSERTKKQIENTVKISNKISLQIDKVLLQVQTWKLFCKDTLIDLKQFEKQILKQTLKRK